MKGEVFSSRNKSDYLLHWAQHDLFTQVLDNLIVPKKKKKNPQSLFIYGSDNEPDFIISVDLCF